MKIKRINKRKAKEPVYCLTVNNEQGIVAVKSINDLDPIIIGQCNFGFLYGAWWTVYQKIQLVKNHLRIPDKDAKESREAFMRLYKVIAQHIEQTKYEFKYGKPRLVKQKDSMGNEFVQQLPYIKEVSSLLGRRLATETVNTALNYAVQSSGADAAKLAICVFEDICKNENIDAFCCNMIHDDIVCESSIQDKERAMNALAKSMNYAANFLMGHFFKTDVTDEVTIFAETPEDQVA